MVAMLLCIGPLIVNAQKTNQAISPYEDKISEWISKMTLEDIAFD